MRTIARPVDVVVAIDAALLEVLPEARALEQLMAQPVTTYTTPDGIVHCDDWPKITAAENAQSSALQRAWRRAVALCFHGRSGVNSITCAEA